MRVILEDLEGRNATNLAAEIGEAVGCATYFEGKALFVDTVTQEDVHAVRSELNNLGIPFEISKAGAEVEVYG